MIQEQQPQRVRFNLLGPLEGWADGVRLRLGGARQERVLATLLLEPGKLVPVSRLVAAAWDEEPPATAAHQVRKTVADLRRRIPGGSGILITDGPGYHVCLADDQLDLIEFGQQVGAARTASAQGRPADVLRALRRALSLWRGPVLSGAGGPVVEAAAAVLEERRLAAAEQFYALRLDRGEASDLVGGLRELVARSPLHEALRGQLMLALYRCGRQAEALEEYARIRELLVEELGIDPGPQLSGMYQAILRDSPEIAAPPALAAPPAPPVPTAEPPCTLPYDLTDFTGRDTQLRELLDRSTKAGERGARLIAIDGMGGSGKTALAVHAAHRMAAAFPDGQLQIDLRGFTPGEPPVAPGNALDILLRALGVPGDRIPDDTGGRTALWRSALLGKRLLLLLDNAVDTAQILPLLPPSGDSLVLITSRARLVALDGAHWISLGVMPTEESARLVTETLGVPRVAAEPAAAVELAQLCDHLPLALRIATARLRNRPRWTVQYLVDRLRDETHRLDELSSGERSVAATLRLSYQAMDDASRTAFRLLALHPGAFLDAHSAAALLGTDVRGAEDVLELLLDAHLVQQPEIGLYSFHDLVGSFARSLRSPATRPRDEAAVESLLDYYLSATERACRVLFPGRERRPTGIAAAAAELPLLADADSAQRWFDREHGGLLAAVALSDRTGHDRYTVCLTRNIVFHLNARGHFDEFFDLGRPALAAARRLQDLDLLAVTLTNMGVACWKLGRFDEGIEVAEEARAVAVRRGDRRIEAHGESTVGLLMTMLGRFSEALPHLERAIAIDRELGATRSEAETLTTLSTLYEQWGRYAEAAAAARRALELAHGLGPQSNGIMALTDLAFAQLGLGHDAQAHASLERALAGCDDASSPGDVALALALSAEVCRRLDRTAQSAEHAARALALVRTSGTPVRQAKVENLVAGLERHRGDHAAALALHAHAHKVASAINYRPEEAFALEGMAHAARALGDHAAAREHRRRADVLFAFMDVPEDHRRR
ncbi:BTAD domain-containing putative transcriptional regulator [Streptomyces sp. NPDC059917]|uniref:AfsR/SARP family transcriptional regulator n=1 Tax=Streptomyces sp. NPDC059917 TaxID=3347002 RepID=UPI003655760D